MRGRIARGAKARLHTIAGAASLLAATGGVAFGAGFELQEGGSKALSMGNAFTAVADDASAIVFNPAGLARFNGMGGQLGLVWVDVHTRHDTDERGDGMSNQRVKGSPIFIPHGHLALGFDLTETIRMGVGGSILAPFGLSLDWGRAPSWGGRFEVTKASIEVIEPNASVALEVDVVDGVSVAVAAGFSLVYGELGLSRAIDFNQLIGPGSGEGSSKIELRVREDHPSWRWNVAGMVRLFDNRVRLGFSYRHQISNLRTYGRAYFTGIPAPAAAQFSGASNRTKLRARLPANLRLGVAVDPIPELTLSFDWRWTNWSIMDTFHLSSSVPALDGQPLEFEYRDSNYFAVGAEYRLMTWEDDEFGVAFRGGLLYDGTPIPRSEVTPLLPGNDRLGFTLGFGVQPTEKMTIDVAYMGLHIQHFRNRHDKNDPSTSGLGRYRTWANLFGITVGLMF